MGFIMKVDRKDFWDSGIVWFVAGLLAVYLTVMLLVLLGWLIIGV